MMVSWFAIGEEAENLSFYVTRGLSLIWITENEVTPLIRAI